MCGKGNIAIDHFPTWPRGHRCGPVAPQRADISMQSTYEFVHTQNVVNFKKQLNFELDRDKRRVLLSLLAEEEAKLTTAKGVGGDLKDKGLLSAVTRTRIVPLH